MMLNNVVRAELHDMIDWYIGTLNNFSVSADKMGKYYKLHLPEQLYQQYCDTYSGGTPQNIWRSLYIMCDLFHLLAINVASFMGFSYSQQDESGIRAYLDRVKRDILNP